MFRIFSGIWRLVVCCFLLVFLDGLLYGFTGFSVFKVFVR